MNRAGLPPSLAREGSGGVRQLGSCPARAYVRLLGPCFKTGRNPDPRTPRGDRDPTPRTLPTPLGGGWGRGGHRGWLQREGFRPGGSGGAVARGLRPNANRSPAFAAEPSRGPCGTGHRATGASPAPNRAKGGREPPVGAFLRVADFRFTPGGFHALLAPLARCFSAFPYGTFALSVAHS